MKKKYGLGRAVPRMQPEELKHKTTKELLGRLKRLQACEESQDVSDITLEESSSTDAILFKNTPEWQQAFHEVKEVLASREHVPGGAERREARLERGHHNRRSEHRNGRRV